MLKEVCFLKENKKLLRYSMQLSMLKQLLNLKLLSETEYEMIRKKLMKDYGIVSDITA
ncbi:MAG: conjugal transfer protein [Lachnospiraceae bacterium]|nr:conjugal transfer protein [Lachnospiraceae bacterium]